jgi:hypothetical protein
LAFELTGDGSGERVCVEYFIDSYLYQCTTAQPPRLVHAGFVKMPLGWERINAKKSSPHENISKEFLERIAAQCLPIMNKHHLAVLSLEEYEPNLEFWGMF